MEANKKNLNVEKKRGFKVPNAYIIVIGIMIFVSILTYIVPAGKYAEITTASGTTVLDPNSFTYVEQQGISLWQFFTAFYAGLQKNQAIIFFLFLLGGYFKIIIDTKAVDGFISLLIDKLGNKVLITIPILMLVMSLLGDAGVLINPVVAFIPIGILLANRLKLDPICAVAVTFVAAYQGFSTTQLCGPTLQTAQAIAELPVLSGFGYRFVIWAIVFVATALYTMRYAKKVSQDPTKSLVYGDYEIMEVKEDEITKFEARHGIIMLIMLVGFGIYSYGAVKYSWGMDYMAAIFFIVGVSGGIVGGLNGDQIVKSFVDGCKEMCFSAMLMGCAAAISILLSEGSILHTITHAFALFLQNFPAYISAPLMYVANVLVNFFVSSGSGQAVVVMPIMAPLADLVGVTRQLAVCAYQFGDGLSNCIFPTNGTMMACIALAGVKYEKWLKWILPLFVIWSVIIMIALMIGVMIGIA
ncbi:YfcC family protein [Intestinibacter sp.]|uniref:YfcC family protein n=1 Tax=Intestinibacter sp. TaxID=1965304 RepID=UPI002A754219|nr:Na+/H+ antiporter NhaC family protein [Intestinibacter sp.]MDY2737798.1 Na+/H+ antiporter NhaC family protein [Intestinibacter sp.]MDY4574427.1 Na+/H+ antiporter NhaC family protein [Intestinibacter sp.]